MGFPRSSPAVSQGGFPSRLLRLQGLWLVQGGSFQVVSRVLAVLGWRLKVPGAP